MIIPTKYIKEEESLIGVGAVVLLHLNEGDSMSLLWENVKYIESVGTYERFILALDLLFLLGVVYTCKNKIFRVVS